MRVEDVARTGSCRFRAASASGASVTVSTRDCKTARERDSASGVTPCSCAAGRALGGIEVERAVDHPRDSPGHMLRRRAEVGPTFVEVGVGELVFARDAREDASAREELPEHGPGAVEVAAHAVNRPAQDLGREIPDLALGRARGVQTHARDRTREAEVDETRHAVNAQDHVRRRDITVDDPDSRPVCRCERVEEVGRDGEPRAHVERSAPALHELVPVEPVDPFEREVGALGVEVVFEKGRDVGVPDRRRDHGLVLEERAHLLARAERVEDALDRDG